MLPFHVSLKSGKPIYEQVVLAIKKALACGQIKPGNELPSVRELSRELQINPNTAQKVISALVNENLIEMRPGIGSVVSKRPQYSSQKVSLILGDRLETLVIEALTLNVSQDEFIRAVNQHWMKIKKTEE